MAGCSEQCRDSAETEWSWAEKVRQSVNPSKDGPRSQEGRLGWLVWNAVNGGECGCVCVCGRRERENNDRREKKKKKRRLRWRDKEQEKSDCGQETAVEREERRKKKRGREGRGRRAKRKVAPEVEEVERIGRTRAAPLKGRTSWEWEGSSGLFDGLSFIFWSSLQRK